MKQQYDGRQESYALVATGSAGQWELSVDETVKGEHRWFVEFDGPSVYFYCQVRQPSVVLDVLQFLQTHLANKNASAPGGVETLLIISHTDGNTVELLWDDETHDRCFVLVSGENELQVRSCLEHSDVVNLVDALQQVRDELLADGLIDAANSKMDRPVN